MTDTTPDEAVEPDGDQAPAAIADEAAAEEALAAEEAAPTPPVAQALALRAEDTIDARIRYARELTAAGDLLPKGVRDSAGKVLLIVETARALGIPAVMGLSSINVIEGKPAVSPALMSALVRRAGHRLRVRSSGTIEGGDYTATATLVRHDDPEFEFEAAWTPHRGERADLCTYRLVEGKWATRARSATGKALPWEKYPEAMCKARAIAEVCREGAEDALMGAHYTPEELGAIVNEEGDLVEAPVVRESVAARPVANEPVATPEQVAMTILKRAAMFATLEDLRRFCATEVERLVVPHAWASDYADLRDYVHRVEVTTNALGRVTLAVAFGHLERRFDTPPDAPEGGEGGPSGPESPQGPQAPAGEPEQAAPSREVHVITTAPERAPEEDPWRGGRAGGDPTHDEAIANVAGALGGEVLSSTTVDAEGVERENAKRARHDSETARKARAAAEASWDDQTPPEEGAGRAAFDAARQKLRTTTTPEENR